MTKLNYDKVNKLRPGMLAESNVIDFQPTDGPPTHDPFTKWCLRCKEPFEYAGLDERGPLIKCCMPCRVDLEYEAHLNGLNRTLADDVLVAAMKEIAAAELHIVEQGYLAQQARSRGNRPRADHHRNRMVLASRSKQAIVGRLT